MRLERKGYTVLELITVMGVIGLLSVLLVESVLKFRDVQLRVSKKVAIESEVSDFLDVICEDLESAVSIDLDEDLNLWVPDLRETGRQIFYRLEEERGEIFRAMRGVEEILIEGVLTFQVYLKPGSVEICMEKMSSEGVSYHFSRQVVRTPFEG